MGLRTFWQHGNGVLLQSFKKDLATCVTLVPLTYRESLDYIRHRLLQVGTCADSVFTAEAMGEIARYARGNPRIMNVLCTNLLITGFWPSKSPSLPLRRAMLLLPIEAKTPRYCGGEVWHTLRECSW